jgi:hypothetical protein
LVRVEEIVTPSTVKATVPVGVRTEPETVAVIVTVWPYTGDDGMDAPSAMVGVGGVVGPVKSNCKADGVERLALARLPLKVAVSVGFAKVVGVNVAVNVHVPPTTSAEGRAPLTVQSPEDAVERL